MNHEITPIGASDIDVFDREIATTQIRLWLKADVISRWHIGQWLKKGKDALARGDFDSWVEEVGIGRRSAYRYMGVAEKISENQIKALAGTGYTELLALVEGPSSLSKEDLAQMSTEELAAEIERQRDEIERHKEREEKGRSQIMRLETEIDKKRDQIHRLQSRPLDPGISRISQTLGMLLGEVQTLVSNADEADPGDEEASEVIVKYASSLQELIGSIIRRFSAANKIRKQVS